MNPEEWKGIAFRLMNGWPSRDFDADNIAVYYDFLKEYEALEVEEAVRALSRRGSRFMPSVGEIEGEIAVAASAMQPTWDEAWPLIRRSVWHADAVGWLREQGAHPYVLSWVESYGDNRLRMEPVDDPDHGGAVIKRLGESYDRFALRAENRQRHGLPITAGATEPRQLDYARHVPEIPVTTEDFLSDVPQVPGQASDVPDNPF